MESVEILKVLENKYCSCISYSDSGYATFSFNDGITERVAFSTKFRRPNYLQFQWQDYGPKRGKTEELSTLLIAPGQYSVQWNIKGTTKIEQLPSLLSAVASVTGCSAGAAGVLLPLLLTELRKDCKSILSIENVSSVNIEMLDEKKYFVIEGSLQKLGDTTIWLSADDFSLKRLVRDLSWTKPESEKSLRDITSDPELMKALSDEGIAPLTNAQHSSAKFITEYFIQQVAFDEDINIGPIEL